MKIRDAIETAGVNCGSIPTCAINYHVVGTDRGEPVKNKRGEIVEPFAAYKIRWWPENASPDEEALEREFELEVEPGGGRIAHWRAGDDDPSGAVTLFVQGDLLDKLPNARE